MRILYKFFMHHTKTMVLFFKISLIHRFLNPLKSSLLILLTVLIIQLFKPKRISKEMVIRVFEGKSLKAYF